MRWKKCCGVVAVMGIVAAAGGVWGQDDGGKGAGRFEVEGLLARLENPATAGEAKGEIGKLPEGALGALYDALGDPTLEAGARAALEEEVPKLHGRIWRERKEAWKKATTAWAEATGGAVFRAAHSTLTGADALALTAIEGAAKEPLEVYGLAKAAVDGGSSDALVLYYYVSRMPEEAAAGERVEATQRLVASVEGSGYAASRKAFMYLRSAAILSDERNGAAVKAAKIEGGEVAGLVAKAVALLPKIAEEKPPQEEVVGLVDLLKLTGGRTTNGNASLLFNRTFGPLNRAFPRNSAVLGFAAGFYTHWAWEARTDEVASKVTEEGWAQFRQRLDQAEKFARQAIEADPAAADGPTAMIEITLGKDGDRGTMEGWFQRAMNADPDNYQACTYKLMYLLPQWGGSEEQALGFGRQCVENGTGENRIPMVLVDAHEELRGQASDQETYMRGPDVWPDLQAAFEKVLGDEEGKVAGYVVAFDRARYLKYAAECGQWEDFAALAKKFGEGIDVEAFGGKALLEFYKEKAAEAAKRPV